MDMGALVVLEIKWPKAMGDTSLSKIFVKFLYRHAENGGLSLKCSLMH